MPARNAARDNLIIVPPPLISMPSPAPIYLTMQIKVNFSAAVLAAVAIQACSPSGSAPPASDTAPSTGRPAATSAPVDPLVVAADKGRIEGDANAKTWLIIASDFQCPFCKQWHDESYKTIYDEYVRPGKIKVAYVNYPLAQHQHAMPTAEAAMCASAQGKFWEFHEALFATQKQWEALTSPTAMLDSIAGAVGVDKNTWKQCIESGKLRPMIIADRDRSAAAGVRSTPTFLIGNRLLLGALPVDSLRVALDAEIAKSAAPAR
jgi:protein-disulfide isomerase